LRVYFRNFLTSCTWISTCIVFSIPTPNYSRTQTHFETHRSWSTVNDWSEALDELKAHPRQSGITCSGWLLFSFALSIYKNTHKNTHGDMQDPQNSQDIGTWTCHSLAIRPIDWWPHQGISRSECRAKQKAPNPVDPGAHRIEKHLSHLLPCDGLTP